MPCKYDYLRPEKRPGKEKDVEVIAAPKAVIPADSAEKARAKRIDMYRYRLWKMRRDANYAERKGIH